MKFGSLFSGIGGMDLGLERAGMECAWQVELDDYCQRVLNKHWPDVERFGDVREVGKHNLKTVDLIAGGFPCQPHSVAGKRKGAADDRNLWPEFIRIIRDLKPRYVLGENVPGIVTTYIDTVLSDLESEGYTCTTFNLPACGFDAPHRRERIFIVAFREDKGIIGGKRIKGNGESKSGKRGIVGRGSESNARRRVVANAESKRERKLSVRSRGSFKAKTDAIRGCEAVADTKRTGQQSRSLGQGQEQFRRRNSRARRDKATWWTVEPHVGRVAHGIPSRVDRLRGLGNAVVPQVAEWIGRRIMEFDGYDKPDSARTNHEYARDPISFQRFPDRNTGLERAQKGTQGIS